MEKNKERSDRIAPLEKEKRLGVAFGVVLDIGGRHFIRSNCCFRSICCCHRNSRRLARCDHLDRVAKILNTVECWKLTDVNRIAHIQTAHIDIDVIRKLGWTATDFNRVCLMLDKAPLVTDTQGLRFTSEVHWYVSHKALTALHLMEVNVRDTVFHCIALNFLHVCECCFALLIDKLDECCPAANGTVQFTKIHYRE